MLQYIARRFVQALTPERLPEAALAARREDHEGSLSPLDPGCDRSNDEAMGWIARAQDCSKTADGGVARHYSLIDGWGASYPETTGYIVPTVLAYARMRGGDAGHEARVRAKRMLDWLVSIQFENGAFQGGMVDQLPCVPVTFNTGQILMGLAAGTQAFGDDYLDAMTRAADWLADTQDEDGCWRRFPTPFAKPGEKTYETHVSWGLLEAHRVRPNARHLQAALKNIRWAMSWQQTNGWIARCCLENPDAPLTHTIGYVLRGILEGYRSSGERELLAAARLLADGLLSSLRPDGAIPGRLDSGWNGTVDWVCLTGSVQIAACWLMLFEETGNQRYRTAAEAANSYVRRTMTTSGPDEIRGGLKGSYPVDGDYGRYQYLNWAPKFLIDANILEMAARALHDSTTTSNLEMSDAGKPAEGGNLAEAA